MNRIRTTFPRHECLPEAPARRPFRILRLVRLMLSLLLIALIVIAVFRVTGDSPQQAQGLAEPLSATTSPWAGGGEPGDREHLASLIQAADDWRLIPATAQHKYEQAQQFALERHLPTDDLPERLKRLPQGTAVPPNSTATVRRVTRVAPAVSIELQVTAPSGQPIRHLTAADFVLAAAAGEPLHYAMAEGYGQVSNRSIALLMDCSQSMAGEKIDAARSAVRRLVNELPSTSRTKLWRFATTVTPLTPWTTDAQITSEALATLRADGHTALYLALDTAVKELRSRTGRRHLIVCTDGKNTTPGVSIDQVIADCQSHTIAIHAIGIEGGDVDLELLQRVSAATGGSYHVAHDADALAARFQELSQELSEPIYRIVILDPELRLQSVSLQIGKAGTLQLSVPLTGTIP